MSCQYWKPVLFDLARGLENAEKQTALLHARDCEECSALLSEQQQLTELLRFAVSNAGVSPARTATDPRTSALEELPLTLRNAFRNHHKIATDSRIFALVRIAAVLVLILAGWMWYRSQVSEQTSRVSGRQPMIQNQNDEEFIPLQFFDHPVNSWQVVRVELGTSELQQFGFPNVPEWENRPVQADIVVGDDGLPHAIRFVTAEAQR